MNHSSSPFNPNQQSGNLTAKRKSFFSDTKCFAISCLFLVLFIVVSKVSLGQLATWSGSWSGTAVSPLAATTLGTNVSSGSLARVNLNPESSSARYNSSAWNNTNNYLTITITATPVMY
jgi:hypothetical protein